jgi:hypothetical protein
MDPLSAIILIGIAAALVTKTAAAGVTDTVASVKGKTPPSLEKWRKRQAARSQRGEAVESDPGPWRRRWRNAVEYRSTKAAQKHQARMEYLHEHGPDQVERHKIRLEHRADRWDRIGAAVAQWGQTSWNAAKTAAAKAQDAQRERQAWKENERRSADPDQATEPETDETGQGSADSPPEPAPAGEGTGIDDTKEVAWPRPEDVAEVDSTTENNPDPNDSTPPTDGGNPVNTPNTATEITDLDTAISFSQETAKYADTVSGTLSDILAQLTAAAQGLAAEAAAYEQGKASLAGEGFSTKVTGRFDVAAEALNTAAEAVKAASAKVSESSEQVGTASGEMRGAVKTFSEQLSLAEQIGAASQDAGVSKRTDFYAPA